MLGMCLDDGELLFKSASLTSRSHKCLAYKILEAFFRHIGAGSSHALQTREGLWGVLPTAEGLHL